MPLDGSDLAERVVPLVESLAREGSAEVAVVEVIPSAEMLVAQAADGYAGAAPVTVEVEGVTEASRRRALEYLRGVSERLKSVGVDARAEVVEGHAAEGIVAFARDGGADLIALTTHGRGGIERVVFGSVADGVVRNAPCPVLVVPARLATPAPPASKKG